MNDTDAVIEFQKGVKITKIAQLLHSIDSWVGYKVEVGCIIATTHKKDYGHRRP